MSVAVSDAMELQFSAELDKWVCISSGAQLCLNSFDGLLNNDGLLQVELQWILRTSVLSLIEEMVLIRANISQSFGIIGISFETVWICIDFAVLSVFLLLLTGLKHPNCPVGDRFLADFYSGTSMRSVLVRYRRSRYDFSSSDNLIGN
jgi:hypothetical protein